MTEPKRILVCDDEPSILKVIECILTEAGFEVELAGNGLAALEKFRQGSYDLLVIDIHMPFLDGFATVAKVREIDKKMPIILEGSYRTPASAELAGQLGVTAYLIKPFEVAELLDTVKGILAGRVSGQAAR